MRIIKSSMLIASLVLLVPFTAAASSAGGHPEFWEPANNHISNTRSLQRGAKYYVNYCLGCHSLKYVRWSSLPEPLNISEEQLIENLMFGVGKTNLMMTNAMREDMASDWFGIAPPDLSLVARSRGTDWIYNYLRAFYLDKEQATGVNNIVFPKVSMPHVLAPLQGYQEAHFHTEKDAQGNTHTTFTGFTMAQQGKLSPEEYDQVVRDIVNFLEYVAEPVQLQRRNIGIGVLAFLLVFFLLVFFLKREFWKDIH
ncbi:MAG TPA: cytochrome c1 [Gammaproteobacteria bacterium]|nr:cytochrome c1 [Gammaproteobacteria bacterium]